MTVEVEDRQYSSDVEFRSGSGTRDDASASYTTPYNAPIKFPYDQERRTRGRRLQQGKSSHISDSILLLEIYLGVLDFCCKC